MLRSPSDVAWLRGVAGRRASASRALSDDRARARRGGPVLGHRLARRLLRDVSYVELEQRFRSDRSTPLGAVNRRALVGLSATAQRIAHLARLEQRRVPVGAAIGRIAIPKVGESFDVVDGTNASSLEEGPGHYPTSAFPGLGVGQAKPIVVLPTAWWITRCVGHERLVLSVCHPLYSASHRIVAFARLAAVHPLGAARSPT